AYSWLVHNTGNAPATIDVSATPTDVTGTGMFARIPRSFRQQSDDNSAEPRLGMGWDAQQLVGDACENKRVNLAVRVPNPHWWAGEELVGGACESTRVIVRARVLNRHWWGDPLQYHFTVSAASGAAVASEETYLQSPPRISTMIQNIVRWIGGRLPFLVIIAAL